MTGQARVSSSIIIMLSMIIFIFNLTSCNPNDTKSKLEEDARVSQKIEGKSKCTQCESDARLIAAAIADYYANPERTEMISASDLGHFVQNPYSLSGDPYGEIIITVEDASGKCPETYQDMYDEWDNGEFTYVMD